MSVEATLRPASTVVLMRDSEDGPEVFMVRRHEGTAFMGGAHVFPGGRVDAGDVAAARDDEELSFRHAAVRELFEEAGVLLARRAPAAPGQSEFVSLTGDGVRDRFGAYRAEVYAGRLTVRAVAERERLELALDALVLFARWVTPPVDPRRFDTRFFLARVPPEQTPVHDATETTQGVWMTAALALDRGARTEIMLPPPTWTTLRELERFRRVDDALRWAEARTIVRREPLFMEHDGRRMLLLPGDPLNPERWAESLPYETRFVHEDGRWQPRHV